MAALILYLEPGEHRIDLRLIRDVRATGGFGCPKIDVVLQALLSGDDLGIDEDRIILPDVVDNALASDLASLVVRNESKQWIHVLGIESMDVRTYTRVSQHLSLIEDIIGCV